MNQNQNKKTLRHFQCRDFLWEIFEQMSGELECSIDYLINEAMRQYARARNYSPQQPGAGVPAPNAMQPQTTRPVGPPSNVGPMPPGGMHGGAPMGGGAPQRGPMPPRPGPPPPVPPGGGGAPRPPRPVPPGGRVTSGMPPAHPGMQPGPPQGYPPHPGAGGMPQHHPQQQQQQPMGGGMPLQQPQGMPGAMPGGMPGGGAAPPGAGMAPMQQGQGARLSLIFNGRKIPITKDQFIIGRGSKTSDLAIKDGNISRKHAAIILHNAVYYIKDLGSTNGIEYNGMRIDNKRVEEGDVFHICDYELRFTYR